MRLVTRLFQRLAILGLGVLTVWLIVSVVFKATDRRLHWVLALSITYAVAAYVILPRALRIGLKVLQRQRVPRYTITGDGLPGDPVNLGLIGTGQQLRSAFAAAGWSESDRLSLASSWRMAKAFLFNQSYPTAPFSTLYLFGRGQDFGFQKAIDDSPRKRHHIRFWALSLNTAKASLGKASFWLNTDCPSYAERLLWVGAGTKDTGLGLTRITFQITHATDSDTNAERDFILNQLKKSGVIAKEIRLQARDRLSTEQVNHYITDGEVVVAELGEPVVVS
jgi:hypothetical protein